MKESNFNQNLPNVLFNQGLASKKPNLYSKRYEQGKYFLK